MKRFVTEDELYIMNYIGSIIIGVAIIVMSVVGLIVGNNFNTTYQKRVEDQARYECATVSRVEVQESETIIGSYIAEGPYQKCLKEKGL